VNALNRYYESVFEPYAGVDFIGFSVWTSNLPSTLLAARHLKRRSDPPFIVAGGPQLTESPASAALALRSGLFDAVAQGEGEETLHVLYTAFCENGRKRVQGIAGTQYVDSRSGELVTVPASLLKMSARVYRFSSQWKFKPASGICRRAPAPGNKDSLGRLHARGHGGTSRTTAPSRRLPRGLHRRRVL
jgi:hypothetical protein